VFAYESNLELIMSKKKIDSGLIGAAGEHLVLSRLLSRGILASMAPSGTRIADILVNPLDGGKPVLIQVKTRSGKGAGKKWHMGEKHQEIKSNNLYYCFVDLEKEANNVYVIPSEKVASIVETSYRAWYEQPGAKGQQRNDTNLRWIMMEYPRDVKGASPGWMNEYLENWSVFE